MQSSRHLSKLNVSISLYRFRYWPLYIYRIQMTLFICKVIWTASSCTYVFIPSFLFHIWTTFNSNCWSSCRRWKHFFAIWEPSFLISLFLQKQIRQFKVEFEEMNVFPQAIAFSKLSALLSLSPVKIFPIPWRTTIGR